MDLAISSRSEEAALIVRPATLGTEPARSAGREKRRRQDTPHQDAVRPDPALPDAGLPPWRVRHGPSGLPPAEAAAPPGAAASSEWRR